MENTPVARSPREVRDALRAQWERLGRPGGDFYTWMIDRGDNQLRAQREKDEKFRSRRWKR
jgi:hypothetical protein